MEVRRQRVWVPGVANMASRNDSHPSVLSVLQELDAVRLRLDHAVEWFSNPDMGLSVAALAKQVESFCQEALHSDDPLVVIAVLEAARECLNEIHEILGAQ
jgi:hypothetical protein